MWGGGRPALQVRAQSRIGRPSSGSLRDSVSRGKDQRGGLGLPRPEGGDRAERRVLLRLFLTHHCPRRPRRMCPAPPPWPWIPLPLRSRCSGSRLQAPRRFPSPWPERAGYSGHCSGAAAVTAAAAGAPAPPVCPFIPPLAPSPRVFRAAAACCCYSGPLRPPPPRRGASSSGLCPPGGWQALLLRPPQRRPRPPPPTRLFEPLCCRSRWRRPRAPRGTTARSPKLPTWRTFHHSLSMNWPHPS